MPRLRIVSQVRGKWESRAAVNSQNMEEAPQVSIQKLTPIFMENEDDNIPCKEAEDQYRLPYLEASLFATILEDTITEIRILVECNNELRVIKTMSDMALHLALKFGVAQPKEKDELEDIDVNNLECNKYKLDKLDADRKYFSRVITDIYVDLALNKKYTSLSESVNKIVSLYEYRAKLLEEETKNRTLRRDLNRHLRQQRNHIKSVIYDANSTIDKLKSGVEDSSLNAEIRSRYVGYWQQARTEQHTQAIYDKESVPSNTIEYYKQRIDHEQRVHSEIELLINIAINETLERVEEWMNKYDKDMENIDLKIQIKKNDYQNMLDRRINLEETMEKHDILMKNWIQFKEEREKARQYREKMTKSAIIVQAWWRGLLVRLQLGPYKVTKKKKPGDDKKKK